MDIKGEANKPEPMLNRLGSERSPDENQKREWIVDIQGGPKPLSHFDYASVLSEAMLLLLAVSKLIVVRDRAMRNGRLATQPCRTDSVARQRGG